MKIAEWREEERGAFSAETACFSLVVCPLSDRRQARFLVLARQPTGGDILIGSGTTESVSKAMKMAEQVAKRSPAATIWTRTLVLLVDDNDALRATVADVLRDNGDQVAEATTCEGALRRLARTDRPVVN